MVMDLCLLHGHELGCWHINGMPCFQLILLNFHSSAHCSQLHGIRLIMTTLFSGFEVFRKSLLLSWDKPTVLLVAYGFIVKYGILWLLVSQQLDYGYVWPIYYKCFHMCVPQICPRTTKIYNYLWLTFICSVPELCGL